jgi:hypothetical protein
MLALLTKISKTLFPYRWINYILLSFFVILITTQLLFFPSVQQVNNNYLSLSFLCCLWLILSHLIIITFNDIPGTSHDKYSWLVRCKIKIKRAGYYLLSLFFVVLSVVILFLSLRLFRTF